jgi:hypothetical protein
VLERSKLHHVRAEISMDKSGRLHSELYRTNAVHYIDGNDVDVGLVVIDRYFEFTIARSRHRQEIKIIEEARHVTDKERADAHLRRYCRMPWSAIL